MKSNRSIEDDLYKVGWIVLGLGSIGLWIYFNVILQHLPFFPCVLYQLFGIYCPGCGGTRAVLALLQGDFLASFWYHPLVPYSVIIFGIFMVTQTLEKFRIPNVKGMKFHPWHLYGALVLLIFNFIVKNILLLAFHITL